MTQEQQEVICEEEEEQKASNALSEIIEVLKKYRLREQDLVLLYGNLGYSIGASIAGVDPANGPTVDELQKAYYVKPTLGTAMMLQGILVTTWYSDINKTNEDEKK